MDSLKQFIKVEAQRLADRSDYTSNKWLNEEILEEYTAKLLSSADIDFRIHMKYRDWTTEALWYLGDKAQLDFHNNGWENYRFKNLMNQRHKLPNKKQYYDVYFEDSILLSFWNGKSFDEYDSSITHWKERLKPKDL